MATNELNKPDNVINIDTAKTQAEGKPRPIVENRILEKTIGQDQAVVPPRPVGCIS